MAFAPEKVQKPFKTFYYLKIVNFEPKHDFFLDYVENLQNSRPP